MSRDPWTATVWSERQAAWWLANLPEYEYEAWKVEGETEDAWPKMGPEPVALEAFSDSGNPADLVSKRPVVIGPPTFSGPTKEGTPAFEWLERLRKAVRWNRLHPADNRAMYWDGKGFTWADVDGISADAEPVRFQVEVSELLRWYECKDWPIGTALAHRCGAVRVSANPEPGGNPPSASPEPNDAFYVAALRLAWKGGAPRCSVAELHRDLQKSGIDGVLSEKTLRRAVKVAEENGEFEYPDTLKHDASKAAQAMFIYAARCHGAQLEGAKPEKVRLKIAELLRGHGLPVPNDEQWVAIDL